MDIPKLIELMEEVPPLPPPRVYESNTFLGFPTEIQLIFFGYAVTETNRIEISRNSFVQQSHIYIKKGVFAYLPPSGHPFNTSTNQSRHV